MSDSQKDRVKDVLRSGAREGVCSLFFYDIGLPNGRTRVYELRDDDGLEIVTKPCRIEHDDPKTPSHVRFIWHWWVAPRPRQLMLPISARKEVMRSGTGA